MMILIALCLLTLLLALSIGFIAGYSARWLVMRLAALQQAIVALGQRKADVPPSEPIKQSAYADPDDLAQRVKYERDQMRERLNQ